MTTVYKIELLVIDHDNLGPDEIADVLHNANYPNDCMYPRVMSFAERDIGEWSDDHPLNKASTTEAEFKRLFGQEANNG